MMDVPAGIEMTHIAGVLGDYVRVRPHQAEGRRAR